MDALLPWTHAMRARGLDIAEPLRLSWYNEAAPSHAVSGHRAEALAVVLGNGRAIWEPFLIWLKQQIFPSSDSCQSTESARLSADPLDEYVTYCVREELKACGLGSSHEIFWGYDLRPGRMVSLQKAASCTGAFAHDGQYSHLTYHESLGAWCSLRALVVFDGIDGPDCVSSSRAELPDEETLQHLATLMRKALNMQGTTSPTDRLTSEAADAWIQFRATAGQNHVQAAFDPIQLSYLVTKDRRLLLSALAEWWSEHRVQCEELRNTIDA